MICSSVPYTPVHYQPDTLDTLPGIEFALDLLYKMHEDASRRLKPSQINAYIHETLRHVCQQKASFQQIFRLIDRTLPIIAIENFNDLTQLLLTELIRYWSIAHFGTASETESPTKRLLHRAHPSRPSADDRERLEALLVHVIRFRCPVQVSHIGRSPSLFEPIQTVLEGTAAEVRWPLIKLFCRHSQELEIDLDLPPSERERRFLAFWPHSILNLLPATDIRQLFDRVPLLHGYTEYLPVLDGEGNLLSWPAQCQLKARCEATVARTDDDFPATKAGIFWMTQRAENDKDPAMRSFWANQAVETALVSTSLAIFNQVMQWSTRFIRDSIVFPELVQSYILGSESSKLLGCVESSSTGGPTTLAALQRTQQADDNLMRILAILTKASKEPLDHTRITGGIMTFLESVVANRMRSLRMHQKQFAASEVDLAVMMLGPLIENLLRYDEEGHELNWWVEGRPMLSGLDIQRFNSPTFLSFMDQLIQRRDKLWASKEMEGMFDDEEMSDDEAPDDKPQKGSPMGLAVQDLIPSYLVPFAVERPDSIPYAAAKVNDVLFGPVEVLMRPVIDPEDVDDLKVDDLEDLIRSFVCRCSRKYRYERLMRVWKHYATVLAPHPLHLTIFRHWLAGFASEWGWGKASRMIDSTSMPETCYLDQPLEKGAMKWEPFGLAGQKDDEIALLTVLFCRMYGKMPSTNVVMKQVDEDFGPERMWSPDYSKHVSQTLGIRGCDAAVLSALLFLGNFTKEPILSEAFPRSEAARWPPIALGSRFLSLANTDVPGAMGSAIQAISDGITFVPTHVLRRLTMSLLDNLSPDLGSEYSIFLECVVELTKLFPSTDQPEMGIDVILRIIEDFPDDSTYHHHLRLISLGKALHPDKAVRLVQSLVDVVCERLSSPFALVKITTVKMVAQLVAAADFIPTGRSLSILQSIHGASSRFDVQTEVISSMLSLLERDSEKADNSFLFLQKLGLSTVRTSETSQSSEPTREELERELPDISGLCSQRNLELFTRTAFHKLPENHRSRYVQEILLPMVDESITHHERWMKQFLFHFGVLGLGSGIEFGPFIPDAVDFVLNIWHDYLPASFLLTHRSSVLAYTTNPVFEEINDHIFRSARAHSLQYASAIQHWNVVLGYHRRANPFHHLNSLLMRDLQPALPGETGINDIDICLEYQNRMGMLAQRPVRFDTVFGDRIVSHETVIQGLKNIRKARENTSRSPENQLEHYQLFHDLLRDIWYVIEDLRRDENNHSLNSRLPSAIYSQTKLIPSPHYNPLNSNPLNAFADNVANLIDQCSDPVTVFDSHYIDDMMEQVEGDLILPLALKMGERMDVDSIEMQTSLTARVVAKLLSKVKRNDIRADARVENMLQDWKESENEFVSRTAWEIDGYFATL
ncbi:uncharacterized protein LDX57_006670 [Aspergillus melleus]|uniref:uncharacterized protein n=1 Tax=Aspergillus melleus TaxID=138277 RepID=UPI001E8DFA15|nr:uncharacterized protein LDX57_006670 [Aspergillus melleus]KAH8428999.1 hypothetical protein LDX57_006670 [Aspergillus melleus]